LRVGRRIGSVRSMPVHAVLLLLVLVVSGCGGQRSSVFNANAPLPPEVTVWYPVGDFNAKGPIGRLP
jgi:hypothetical protein